MPRVDDGDAREAVKIFAAVNVGDARAAGLVHDDGCNGFHEAGHYEGFVFLDCVCHVILTGPKARSVCGAHSYSELYIRSPGEGRFHKVGYGDLREEKGM